MHGDGRVHHALCSGSQLRPAQVHTHEMCPCASAYSTQCIPALHSCTPHCAHTASILGQKMEMQSAPPSRNTMFPYLFSWPPNPRPHSFACTRNHAQANTVPEVKVDGCRVLKLAPNVEVVRGVCRCVNTCRGARVCVCVCECAYVQVCASQWALHHHYQQLLQQLRHGHVHHNSNYVYAGAS